MSTQTETCTAATLDDDGTIDLPDGLIAALDLTPGDTLVYRIVDDRDGPVVIVEKGG